MSTKGEPLTSNNCHVSGGLLLHENDVSSVGPSISAMSAAHFVHVATTD